MPKKVEKSDVASCCKVDALVTIDGRGQIVLPKDIRARAGIEGGDKLAVISWESGRQGVLPLPDQGGRIRDLHQGAARPDDGRDPAGMKNH